MQDEDEAVFLHVAHGAAGAVEFDAVEPGGQGGGFLARDAARAAVGHPAVGVEGAEVGPHGDVARSEGEVDAEGFEHAAAGLVHEGVVAEQGQVAGAAARGDARGNGVVETARPGAGEFVEVRGAGGLEFGRPPGLAGQPAQPVEHVEQHLAPAASGETGDPVEFHAAERMSALGGWPIARARR